MWRVTPPGYVQEYGETTAIRIRFILPSTPPPRQGFCVAYHRTDDAPPALRQIHVPAGGCRLAPARPRAACRRQARVRRRLRGFRRRSSAADLLPGRDARGRGPAAAQPGPEPRPDPRIPRCPGPERVDEVVHGAVFPAGDDQTVGVLRRVTA